MTFEIKKRKVVKMKSEIYDVGEKKLGELINQKKGRNKNQELEFWWKKMTIKLTHLWQI